MRWLTWSSQPVGLSERIRKTFRGLKRRRSMPAKYVSVDRDTALLLPPDMWEWVPEDHLVHFILEAVEQLDVRAARVYERGTGNEQYPPSLLLALLIYSYAAGVFSSRQIERSTYDSVAVRVLCADTHLDHDTLCTFRRQNAALLAGPSRRCWNWRRTAGCSRWPASPWRSTARRCWPTRASTPPRATRGRARPCASSSWKWPSCSPKRSRPTLRRCRTVSPFPTKLPSARPATAHATRTEGADQLHRTPRAPHRDGRRAPTLQAAAANHRTGLRHHQGGPRLPPLLPGKSVAGVDLV